MLTVLRVSGDIDELERFVAEVADHCGLPAKVVRRRSDAAVDLAQTNDWSAHLRTMEENLSRVMPVLRRFLDSGCTAFVDTGVSVFLPSKQKGAAVTGRAMRLSSRLITALAQAGIEYELTVYVQSDTEEESGS